VLKEFVGKFKFVWMQRYRSEFLSDKNSLSGGSVYPSTVCNFLSGTRMVNDIVGDKQYAVLLQLEPTDVQFFLKSQ
jgi:hypothetical protein